MPTLYKDRVGPLASRPARGERVGSIYMTTDGFGAFEWNGAAWLDVDPAPGTRTGYGELTANVGFTSVGDYDPISSLIFTLPLLNADQIITADLRVVPVTTTSKIRAAFFTQGNFNGLVAFGYKAVDGVAAAETDGRVMSLVHRVPAGTASATWQVGCFVVSGATNANVLADTLSPCHMEAKVSA